MGGRGMAVDTRRFRDRAEAGRLLAERLREYAGRDDVVVLGLPRGGVPVAYEVARALGAPLDVFLVRKLGVPGHEELAMGAIATGGVAVLNKEVVERSDIPAEWIEAIAARERRELERRERAYRGDRPPPRSRGRTVILVDDGLATGSTMRAAVQAVRPDEPARIVVAVPVAAPDVCAALRARGRRGRLRSRRGRSTPSASGTRTSRRRPTRRCASCSSGAAPAAGAADGPRRRCAPLPGRRDDYDAAARARRPARGSSCSARRRTARTSSTASAREITKRLIAEARLHARWRSRPTGPTPTGSTASCAAAGDDASAEEALADFRRFPAWMWRNTDVVDFVELAARVQRRAAGRRRRRSASTASTSTACTRSMEAVLAYLDEVDPEAAQRARERYACFDHFGGDPQVYGYEAGIGGRGAVRAAGGRAARRAARTAAELARPRRPRRRGRALLRRAERAAGGRTPRSTTGRCSAAASRPGTCATGTWPRRSTRWSPTSSGRSGPAKVVVWAHNSHLGDARATEIGQAGELNLGQLVRERARRRGAARRLHDVHGHRHRRVGLGRPGRAQAGPPRAAGQLEELFHEQGAPRFLLEPAELRGRRLERAIGVIYRPETERISHYFHARLADQFDAVHPPRRDARARAARAHQRVGAAASCPRPIPWGV